MEQSDQATNIDHMAFQPTHSVLKTVDLWVLEIKGVLERAGISNEPVVKFTVVHRVHTCKATPVLRTFSEDPRCGPCADDRKLGSANCVGVTCTTDAQYASPHHATWHVPITLWCDAPCSASSSAKPCVGVIFADKEPGNQTERSSWQTTRSRKHGATAYLQLNVS